MKRILLVLLCASSCLAQGSEIEAAARKAIDAGNQAWVDGVKSGDMTPVVATYADDGLDCGPAGECRKGRAAIEREMKASAAKVGRATSASVTSVGAIQQGDFVYEWGHADAAFPGGSKISGRYLTVWRREPGGWKIFRNMSIPPDRPR